MTCVVATSDFHGTLPEIPECDLLLVGGDVCPVWDHNLGFQAKWVKTTFREWLDEQPAKEIVVVAGNHDFIFQTNGPKKWLKDHCIYLENESAMLDCGLKVWGSPYSNKFGGWAFMKKDNELANMWDTIPRDSDIIVVHGPPWGYGDTVLGFSATKRGMVEPEHVGSTSLANQLYYDVWENLKLVVSGHIHEGYGVSEMKNWKVLNVSQMDDLYKPVNPPMVIDL